MALRPDDLRLAVERELLRVTESNWGTQALSSDEEERLAALVADRVGGYGPVQPLLDDPTIEEMWINAPDRIFVATRGVGRRVDLVLSESEVRRIVERMLWQAGRRIDAASPFVDASLPDGSRLHVAIPDATAQHWAVNIRKFSRSLRTLTDLQEAGSLSRAAAEFLRMSVLAGLNIIVSGATQAGKTTLLNALLGQARSNERLITVEETRELDIDAEDIVALQCRAPNLEGRGEITLRRLISEALRMRPTRLVVGEVRGAECLDLLIALNSGLAGACSLHANSAREALTKMTTLPLLAGGNVDARFVERAVATCVDLVVHCAVDASGRRSVREILSIHDADAQPGVTVLFECRGTELVATGEYPERREKFDRAGYDPAHVLDRGA